MAVINDPTIPANIAGVGMGAGITWQASHNTFGPLSQGNGGAFRVAAHSGVINASLAGGTAELFQFRFATATNRIALVTNISFVASGTVAAGAVGQLGVRLRMGRAWTALGTGGTRLVLTNNNGKARTAHQSSEVNDIAIATTGALGVSTKTFDAQDLGGVSFAILTGVATTMPAYQFCPKVALFDVAQGGWPLILANQEGFIITSAPLQFPAGLTWSFDVEVSWMEVDSF